LPAVRRAEAVAQEERAAAATPEQVPEVVTRDRGGGTDRDHGGQAQSSGRGQAAGEDQRRLAREGEAGRLAEHQRAEERIADVGGNGDDHVAQDSPRR